MMLNCHCVIAKMLQSNKQTSQLVLRTVQSLVLPHFREEKSSIKCYDYVQRTFSSKDKISLENQMKAMDMLKKFGFSEDEIHQYPQLLTLHPQTLEHRGLVLKEGSFRVIIPFIMYRYRFFANKDVSFLKAMNFIDPQTNVADSFLYHLGNPPLDGLPSFKERCKFVDIYNVILKTYLLWRLETTSSTLETIMNRYPRIKHKSLRYISQTLDILENELGFSKDKILRNGFLIHSHPINLRDTLERVPELGGVDIRQVLLQHPKIILSNTDNLISISEHLKDYGIPDSAVQRCFDIFTLSSTSVSERLQQLQAVPELRVFSENKRVMRLVHYQRKVFDRISRLQDIQIRCISLNMLSSTEHKFDRFTREGEFRTRGFDTTAFVASRLKRSPSEIRTVFQRHRFWCHVPIMNIEQTFDLLLRTGFSNEDIFENLHILLYPSDVVEKELTSVTEKEEVIAAEQLHRMCSKEPNYPVPLLTDRKKLAMCLYFIERRHHFSGNGVWTSSINA